MKLNHRIYNKRENISLKCEIAGSIDLIIDFSYAFAGNLENNKWKKINKQFESYEFSQNKYKYNPPGFSKSKVKILSFLLLKKKKNHFTTTLQFIKTKASYI